MDSHIKEYVTYSQLGNNGRAANQFFQIANTLSYAIDHNKEAVFPEWKYNKYFKNKLNTGTLDHVDHKYCFHFHYVPIPETEGNVDLFGFGQSEKYFKKNELAIRNAFVLEYEYKQMVVNNFCFFNLSSSKYRTCAIHVRRGDYTTPETMAYHGLMGLEYYEKAAHKLYDNLNDVLFVIFSDDIEWCKLNFKFPNQTFSEEKDEIIDLFTIALCDDFIISNSSYGWWGAWLSQNKDKRVVAPAKWFNNADLITDDIYCENWIKV